MLALSQVAWYICHTGWPVIFRRLGGLANNASTAAIHPSRKQYNHTSRRASSGSPAPEQTAPASVGTMAVQVSSRRSNSVRLSLDSWVHRSSSPAEVDSMVFSHDPDDCDTTVHRQGQSLLMSLPIELLLLISDFQEPNDAAAFTLSCKRASCALGLSSWMKIGRGSRHRGPNLRKARWKFLQALERDLPTHHLCHFGEIFLKISHKNHSPHSSNFIPSLDNCRRTNLNKISEACSPYTRIATRLSFCDVQSILKAVSLGETDSFDRLNISNPWLKSSSWKYGQPTYLIRQDEKASIHNGELYIYTCSRRWALCSAEDFRDKKHLPISFLDMPVCRHQHLDLHEKSVKTLIRASIPEVSDDTLEFFYPEIQPLVSSTFGCFRCPIECRFTIFNHGPDYGVELALEVAHVLGSASSLHDPEWASRGAPECQRYSFDERSLLPVASMYQPSRFPFNRHGPRLPGWDKAFPDIFKEPGKALNLFCPDGVPNAFDPVALRLAREQSRAMRNHVGGSSARMESEVIQDAPEESQSRWQRLNKKWSKRRDSKSDGMEEEGDSSSMAQLTAQQFRCVDS